MFYKAAFDLGLSANNTYTMTNFESQKNDLMFKTTDHKHVLKFIDGTIVSDVNKHTIPKKWTRIT